MPTRLICLANSFKEGGRCIAGIELDSNNIPVFVNSIPKWIRPVCNTEHGEIPNNIAQPFKILDIIELDVTGLKPESYQSENVTFNETSIKTVGTFERNKLVNLCDGRSLIFRNKGKAVSLDAIGTLNHSLMLASVNQFEVTQKIYEDKPGKSQIRLVFTYNDNRYDFPVTDPVFLHRHQGNPDFLVGAAQVYLCLSLGIAWEGWHYKLIAGIIF